MFPSNVSAGGCRCQHSPRRRPAPRGSAASRCPRSPSFQPAAPRAPAPARPGPARVPPSRAFSLLQGAGPGRRRGGGVPGFRVLKRWLPFVPPPALSSPAPGEVAGAPGAAGRGGAGRGRAARLARGWGDPVRRLPRCSGCSRAGGRRPGRRSDRRPRPRPRGTCSGSGSSRLPADLRGHRGQVRWGRALFRRRRQCGVLARSCEAPTKFLSALLPPRPKTPLFLEREVL